jgi:hypothetical protein
MTHKIPDVLFFHINALIGAMMNRQVFAAGRDRALGPVPAPIVARIRALVYLGQRANHGRVGDRARAGMARLGFIIDYIGRLLTFSLILLTPWAVHEGWLALLAILGLIAAAWFGSRVGRYFLAGHAIDPVLQMPPSWW